MRTLTHPERLDARETDISRKIGTEIDGVIEKVQFTAGAGRQARTNKKVQPARVGHQKARGLIG
jgi:hypothetical protein